MSQARTQTSEKRGANFRNFTKEGVNLKKFKFRGQK